MTRKHLAFATIVLGLVMATQLSTTRADVIISMPSTVEVEPDSITRLPVTITGDDEFNLASFEFRIVPQGNVSSQLRFLEESENFLADAAYIFSGNSFAQDDGIQSSVGAVSTSNLPSDTFIGGDTTSDFENVSLNNSALLVELRIQHDSGPANPLTTIGDQFTIELVPNSGDSSAFANGNSNTGFLSDTFEGIRFTSTSATFVIAVPEPVNMMAIGIGAMSMLFYRRKR